MLSLDLLRKGSGGIGGSTGAALGHNLSALRSLVDGMFARVRLESGSRRPARIAMPELLRQVASDVAIDTTIRGVHLTVEATGPGLDVWADSQLLEAAIARFVQNAIAFTAPGGRALLTASAEGDRMLVEIYDECGGLTAEGAGRLATSLETPGGARQGHASGLSIARECAEAVGGVVSVRNVPNQGCVLGIVLRRHAAD
jgi:hypothetical protein